MRNISGLIRRVAGSVLVTMTLAASNIFALGPCGCPVEPGCTYIGCRFYSQGGWTYTECYYHCP